MIGSSLALSVLAQYLLVVPHFAGAPLSTHLMAGRDLGLQHQKPGQGRYQALDHAPGVALGRRRLEVLRRWFLALSLVVSAGWIEVLVMVVEPEQQPCRHFG